MTMKNDNFHSNNIYVSELLLKVQDINRAKEFYQSIMGFKILKDSPSQVQLTANGKDPIISLIEPDNVKVKAGRRTGLYHIAILLTDKIQLGLFLKNLKDKSYPIVGGSNHGVSNALYLQDPDDNGIEVYADLDSNQWKRNDKEVEMVSLPLDYESLISNTGDKVWQGAPSNTIIGHIHLHVRDLDEADKFYIEGLGMDLVSRAGRSASFYSSKGYHHHIAANIWNGRGSPPLDQDSVGMKHYTIKFPNEKLLKDTFNRIKEQGYESFEDDGDIFVADPSSNLTKFSLS